MISSILRSAPAAKKKAPVVVKPSEARIRSEIAVFQRKGITEGVYRFFLDEPKPYLLLAARTNKQNVYTLRVELNNFPNVVPKVFVRMLKDRDGNKLNDVSAAMHTLQSEHGWTRICHYGSISWTPNVSLYKIYVKCCLWLNMYELHLESGHTIDYYLNHQA